MDKQIVNNYRVSGNQITHLKLSKLLLSENETLSMLNRYRLCTNDEQNLLEELSQNNEEKYQAKNYLAIYSELSKYSIRELFKLLLNKIFSYSEKKKLLLNTIIIIAFSYSIFICTFFDESRFSLGLIKISRFIIGVMCIIAPAIIAFLVFVNLKQVIYKKKHYEKKIGFYKQIICVVGILLFILNLDKGFNFINMADENLDKIYVVEAAELYGGNSFTIDKYDDQITEKYDDQIIEMDEGNVVPRLIYSDIFVDTVEETYKSLEYEYFYDLSYQYEDVVAKDIDGNEYSISQISNQKLLVPYLDGEKAVLFYGQFNNNYWDGDCIFNIYEYNEDIGKNVLTTILEANYNNGNLVSYKKITKTTTGQGVDVWSVSDRVRENGYNCGETYYYFQLNDYFQDFDLDMAGVENIIYVDNFENILKKTSTLEGYYYGNTSDGYYNDDTGNAYMVKYAEDGTIRTFYRGGFKNGYPDDQTGNAWQIVFDSSYDINRYFYYKGMFKNGKRVGRVTSNNYVEQVQIDQIIDGMVFNCPLNWYAVIE